MVEHDEQAEETLRLMVSTREWHTLLQHVLTCPPCKERVLELLAERPIPAREAAEARDARAVGPLLMRLEASTPGLLETLERQAEEAAELCERLAEAPEQRRFLLAQTRKFRSLPLASLLLVESWETAADEPETSEDLERLAFLVGSQTYPAEQASLARAVRTRAQVLRANARRLLGDREGAERCFLEAAAHLGDPYVTSNRAFYSRMLALLRRDQGDVDDAVGLLRHAAVLYGSRGDAREQGVCLATLGLLLVETGATDRALQPLTLGCAGMDLHRDPGLAARARLALAVCHAAQGRTERAVQLVERTRPLYAWIESPAETRAVLRLEEEIVRLTGRQN